MTQLSGLHPPAPPPAASGVNGPPLEARDFETISKIAYREAGLAIAPGKSAMIRTRLARRLRALRLGSYAEYCDLVTSAEGAGELRHMISALTTNVSHFFRESHHFDTLREKVLPPLMDRMRAGGKARIWSAGCSNGQEPYSIALTALEAGLPPGADFRILGTDIDPDVIAHARAGSYPPAMIDGLPPALRTAHFTSGPGESWMAKPALKELISFRELNLIHPWPMRGRFDAIFCRNVVIYFDAETQDRLWTRFAEALAPGGWLFLGHSERVSDTHHDRFRNAGVTTYQRAA